MKKAISILLAVLVMLSCFAGFSANAFAGTKPPFTGWYYNEDSEYWSYYEKGSYVSEDWRSIDGKWYYFGEYGNMYFDGIYDIGEDAYYFNKSGAMLTGWIKDTYTYSEGNVSINWYYAESSGRLAEGWKKISGKWYYFYGYGNMAENTSVDDGSGKFYFVNKDGSLKTTAGWVQEVYSDGSKGNWYYTDSNGVCATGWKKISGKWYCFSYDSGFMYENTTIEDGGNYYLVGKDGAMISKTGWASLTETWNGKAYTYWFYVENSSGVLATGWKEINGITYYFDTESGEMYCDGYYDIDGYEYYFNETGECEGRTDEF